MEKSPILIASASLDEHAYGPVSSLLEDKGYAVVVYKTDKVISGEDQLNLHINSEAALTITYNDTPILPEDIGAAWFRKLTAFDQGSLQDRAKQLYINSELTHFHNALWELYPENKWLNAPARIRQADGKFQQLLLAHEVGLNVPDTVISSDWDEIRTKLLIDDSDTIIVKTIRGIISDKEKLKAMYTTKLDVNMIENMRDKVSPFPGIYQPFFDKYREWRVTVVGESVFPAAIYTTGEAKVDWRTEQTTGAVEFRHEELPDGVEEKCIRYLGEMGLKYGAFDFVERHNGQIVFLECNPNGQYGWLEEALGFPISHSIATELINIATSR